MDAKLLDILACPVTKGPLIYDKANQELISVQAGLAVQHNAYNDPCEALVTKELAFDIEPLSERYWEMYRERSGVILLDIEDYHPLVAYRF